MRFKASVKILSGQIHWDKHIMNERELKKKMRSTFSVEFICGTAVIKFDYVRSTEIA